MSQPHFVIVAGANGSGKSTSAPALLPPSVPCINADEIAKTLALDAEGGKDRDREASRLLLERWDALAAQRDDFAIETTLSSRSLAARIQRLQASGYEFHLMFFWLKSPDLSVARVAERVRHGGHDIPEATIRRRYVGGVRNLFDLYIPLAASWRVLDNSDFVAPVLVAGSKRDAPFTIYEPKTWQQIEEVRNGG